jgi:hypothetical protein
MDKKNINARKNGIPINLSVLAKPNFIGFKASRINK